jgi:hypothetical protein
MDKLAQEIAAQLDVRKIGYTVADNGRLRIPLAKNFGELEVGSIEDETTMPNDTIVALVNSDWHTHGDVLKGYRYANAKTIPDAIMAFIADVFANQYYLIEEDEPGKKPKRLITEELDRYLKYLPPGAKYKIYNK